MSGKASSSRKPSSKESESGRGRSSPSSRQSKVRAEKVKHRSPTPHPAKRSSTQLFGPQPPPSTSAVPVSSEPRPLPVKVGLVKTSVADAAMMGDDDLWTSQNSPRSPAGSPWGSSPVPVSSSPDRPVAAPEPLASAAPLASGLPARGAPVCTTNLPSHAPVFPATHALPSVAVPPTGMTGPALRAPLMTPWPQGAPWTQYPWPAQFPSAPSFPPPPGFSTPWSMMSMYPCPPPPGFADGTSRRPVAPPSSDHAVPVPRSSRSATRQRASTPSDESEEDSSPPDRRRRGSSLPPLDRHDNPPVHMPATVVDGVPGGRFSVHDSALRTLGIDMAEFEGEVSDSYSVDGNDDEMPLLSNESDSPSP